MRFTLCLLTLLCVAATSSAVPYWVMYTNGGGDAKWSTAANWDSGVVPTVDGMGYAVGMGAGVPTLQIDGEEGYAETKNLLMNVWGAPTNDAELLQDVAFYVSESATIGYAGAATFTNNSGSMNVGGTLFIGSGDQAGGNGTYVQNGGSLTTGWRMLIGGESYLNGSTGFVDLKAGTITVGGPLEINAGGLLNIDNGTLWFAADSPENLAARIAGYISEGKVTAFGGTGLVKYQFDEAAWKMRVWAEVPEPVTMSLLAVGGLGLLVNRKK